MTAHYTWHLRMLKTAVDILQALRAAVRRNHRCHARILFLGIAAASSGCATTTAVVAARGGVQGQPATLTANGPARTTGGGRTQTVGLPLPPAAKIGLWTGVAVILAFAMADSDDATDDAGTGEP
jgi:hypothetical protein